MDGMNRYLNEQAMRETIRGGPARYRLPHQATDPHAALKADDAIGKANMMHRQFTFKLPGLPRLTLKLPRWALLGTLTN
jgi:hypothetical protein